MNEIHPFEPFIPNGATKLIIGTIPPERFSTKSLCEKDVNFYYGSKDNTFWELLKQVTDSKLDFLKINNDDEINKRKFFLKSKNIGICDIIKETKRKNNSSLDEDLEVQKYLDIVEILQNNPTITTLIYTSSEGGVKTFMTKYLKEKFNKEICHQTISKNDKKYKLLINNNEYDVQILYSPAPTALRRLGKNGIMIRFNQWREVFKLK